MNDMMIQLARSYTDEMTLRAGQRRAARRRARPAEPAPRTDGLAVPRQRQAGRPAAVAGLRVRADGTGR
ncbi:MAG TPA: hypothetical protein VGD91_31820 [Trebonia sp.]